MKKIIISASILLCFIFTACRDEFPEEITDCNISSFQREVSIDLSVNTIITDPLGREKEALDVENGDLARISAIWNMEAYWELKIIGLSSRAFETFSGCGNLLTIDWDGINRDHGPYYEEDCMIELSFPENPNVPTFRDTLTISNSIDFNKQGLVAHKVDGFAPRDYLYGQPGRTSAENYYVTLDSALGGKYAQMNVIPNANITGNRWRFLGSLLFRSVFSPPNFNVFYPITEIDPQNLYLNFLVYNSGLPSRINVTLLEGGTSDHFYSGAITDIDWTGWQYVSIKLSDMFFGPRGRTVNYVPNLDQIFLIRLSWFKAGGAIEADEHVFLAIDHVVFTYGNPVIIEP